MADFVNFCSEIQKFDLKVWSNIVEVNEIYTEIL